MKELYTKRKKGFIFVISGPSGSGKTTLRDSLLSDSTLRGKLGKVVSLTTRLQKAGEKNKKDYIFITEKEFKRLRQAKKVLEWTTYLGYYYATPKAPVEGLLKKGINVILCLDIKGALIIKKLYPKKAITIFVVPPSLKALQERIEGRCRETKREITQRLKMAQQELSACNKYDYCLVNEQLHKAIQELKNIVLEETGLH